MVGPIVLTVTLALALAVGLIMRRRDGRVRAVTADVPDLRADLAALGVVPGERATLVQFSSAFCAPCRVTRRLLSDVAEIVPGVTHVEVDAESHLELVRRLNIRRTPTVLILDEDCQVLKRASGAPPSRDAVMAAIAG